MTTGVIQVFARQGRIIICNCEQLNDLLQGEKGDMVGVIPIAFYPEDCQLRKADAEEFKNLLPNAILSSPFQLNFGQGEYDDNFNANSEPFSLNKLKAAVKKLELFKLLGI